MVRLPELDPVDMHMSEESEPISKPMSYPAQPKGETCDDCSCCDWSPHKGHGWWLAVMLLLVFFAGVACTYLIQEWDLLESEIEATQNGDLTQGIRESGERRGMMEDAAMMTDLTGAFVPFRIQYPKGWHVFSHQEIDPETNVLTSYASFARSPFVELDGSSADIQIVDYVAKDVRDQDLMVSENTVFFRSEKVLEVAANDVRPGYVVYRAIEPVEQFNQPEKGPYAPLYQYVIAYQGFGAADQTEYHVMVASVVTLESPAGLIAPSDTKAVLDDMIKTFAPPQQLSQLR